MSARFGAPTIFEIARRRRVYWALAFFVGMVLAVGVGFVLPI